jgi:hypothetical protein
MLGIPFLSLILRFFGQRAEGQADERQLRRELLAHQRRQLVHQRIPDVHTARDTFGPRFDALHQLLVAHDPAGVGASAPTNAYYPELTRTLLYQLDKAGTSEQLLSLLRQEQSLWFGPGSIYEEELAELARAVEEWRCAAGL